MFVIYFKIVRLLFLLFFSIFCRVTTPGATEEYLFANGLNDFGCCHKHGSKEAEGKADKFNVTWNFGMSNGFYECKKKR